MGNNDTEVNAASESMKIVASAPCRIDMGGTLDISTFIYPLHYLHPCTFNLGLDLRTQVTLHSYKEGRVKISSKGFESAEYPVNEAPFDHPLGLMFAVATYFQATGVHIHIESSSPPRSALGGSSAAAVALVAALTCCKSGNTKLTGSLKKKIAMLAYAIEGSVAGVPCGLQDQLAAVYGGANAWYWVGNEGGPQFQRRIVVKKSMYKKLEKNFILAYCGVPHESKDINGRWVKEFISGGNRSRWHKIVSHTRNFVEALCSGNIDDAVKAVNCELSIRREMTPDVLDDMGKQLVQSAKENKCGVRFTGAGGGGCIWAIGKPDHIERLRHVWEDDLKTRDQAHLIDLKIDSKGLIFHGDQIVNI